jgi:heptosyltransferase-2
MSREVSRTDGNGRGLEAAERWAQREAVRQAEPARILVVLPNWVGDVVLATPALRALRTRFSGAHITVLCRSHLADILSGGDWMDEVVHWPRTDARSRQRRRESLLGLAGRLREQEYDWAVLLANSFRTALVARLAGIRRRIGYDRDGRGLLLTDRLLPERRDGRFVPLPMIRYYNAMARYLGCRECPTLPELFTTPEQDEAARRLMEEVGVQAAQPIVALNPGSSYGVAKRWPAERFAAVADGLSESHGAVVFVLCGPKEIETAHEVARLARARVTVMDGSKMSLGMSKALIRRARLLVTNDTGPRHFANAFGTPVLTVFGPTDPEWTATDAPAERIMMVKVHCGPCQKRNCPLDHRCMTRITPEMVLGEARSLLTAETAARAD